LSGTAHAPEKKGVPLLAVCELAFARGQRTIFEGLSFEARAGEVTVLLGPNGVGKSTLIGSIAGIGRVASGVVLLDGRPIGDLSRRARSQSVALLTQEAPDELPYTVRELVLLGRAPHQGPLGIAGQHDLEIVDEVLAETSLTGLEGRLVRELSGGERRRAFLAQALAQQPRVLLLDEPTAFLDLRFQFLFWEIVKRRVAKGLCVIAVLHDPNLAAQWADQVVLMPRVGACRVGSIEAMLTLENLESLYEAQLQQAGDGAMGERFFALRA
jgi:iron complex transport system ATP-binding protein